MKELNLSEFTNKIYNFKTNEFKTEKFTIVDFYANWCQPCKALEPILKQIDEALDIEIIKIDAEEEYPLTEHFQIRSLPTLIFIYNGNIHRYNGQSSKSDIISEIKKHMTDNILV
jgi:thioredoxin